MVCRLDELRHTEINVVSLGLRLFNRTVNLPPFSLCGKDCKPLWLSEIVFASETAQVDHATTLESPEESIDSLPSPSERKYRCVGSMGPSERWPVDGLDMVSLMCFAQFGDDKTPVTGGVKPVAAGSGPRSGPIGNQTYSTWFELDLPRGKAAGDVKTFWCEESVQRAA
jgi:hypothetical protein